MNGEIDEDYISPVELENLNYPLMLETLMYTDDVDCTWVAGMATDIDTFTYGLVERWQ